MSGEGLSAGQGGGRAPGQQVPPRRAPRGGRGSAPARTPPGRRWRCGTARAVLFRTAGSVAAKGCRTNRLRVKITAARVSPLAIFSHLPQATRVGASQVISQRMSFPENCRLGEAESFCSGSRSIETRCLDLCAELCAAGGRGPRPPGPSARVRGQAAAPSQDAGGSRSPLNWGLLPTAVVHYDASPNLQVPHAELRHRMEVIWNLLDRATRFCKL